MDLAETLTQLGATVKVVRLPSAEGGRKVGLDDFLVAYGPDALKTLLETAEAPKTPIDDRPEVEPSHLEYLSIKEATALAEYDKVLFQRGRGTWSASIARYARGAPSPSDNFRHSENRIVARGDFAGEIDPVRSDHHDQGDGRRNEERSGTSAEMAD